MEVSVMGSCASSSTTTTTTKQLLRFCRVPQRRCNKGFVSFHTKSSRVSKSGLRFTFNAARFQPVRSEGIPVHAPVRSKSVDGVNLFVGLPMDAVSDCNTVNHTRAIAVGLRALKLLGVEGVEMPVWWGIAEKKAMGKYEWSGYLALAEMVHLAGLKLHVSLCFHGNQKPRIPLPDWVSLIGESRSDIFYMDRSGQHYKDCLSLAADNLPVLNGKTPVQVYEDFCESFKSSFSHLMGSTITGITMGLGPGGELGYPSHQGIARSRKIFSAGEFQCYDPNMLNLLKQHAEASGNPLWGLGGPHDASSYDQLPNTSNFFKDQWGSWESPYGNFFLSWYSTQLLSHGDRLLSLASTAFSSSSVAAYGKIPLIHSWYKTPSHPSELTAGFYNTATRDGYDAVAEMFARNSCGMIVPGMDLSDEHQPGEYLSSPESLLSQIRSACRKHGVELSGQNSSVSKAPYGFEQIKNNIAGQNVINLFTYQRMGADFFSPEHFPSFTSFVRSLDQLETHPDDLPEEAAEAAEMGAESGIHMQTA